MATTILPAATAGANSSLFHVREDDPVTIFATGTLVAEEITIQISPNNGANWYGTSLKLAAAAPMVGITTPGTFRAVKPATTNSVGIAVASRVYGL